MNPQSRIRSHGCAVAALAASLLLLAAGCCGRPRPGAFAQPEGRPVSVVLPGGDSPSPPMEFGHRVDGAALPRLPRFAFVARSTASKFVPPLADWLRDSSANRRADVVISYTDPVEFPRLPVEALESADTLAAAGAARAVRTLVDSVRALRDVRYRPEVARLARAYGAQSIRTHTLTQCIEANLRLEDVARLARRWDVVSLQLVERGAPPPEDCPDPASATSSSAWNPYPCEARSLVGTDPYFDAGKARGRIVLFDTGVNTGHQALSPLVPEPGTWPVGPHVLRSLDVSGDPAYASESATDLHRGGHGSKSASILVGLGVPDGRYRGVGNGWLTAYRVYRPDPEVPSIARFNLTAYLRSVVALEYSPPSVLLVETQDSGGVFGDVAREADQLFQMGTAVVAPVGNKNEVFGSSVGSPAISARVLAVGGRPAHDYDRTTDAQLFDDDVPLMRGKPDLQAPTWTLGAHGQTPDDYESFPKTSGAAPYAAGAARIVRNLLQPSPWAFPPWPPPVDPGQVYAALIAFASNDRPYPVEEGAGPFRLPSSGLLLCGKTSVRSGQTVTVGIPVSADLTGNCRVAIWWPDPRPRPFMGGLRWLIVHHDVDLEVMIPGEAKARVSAGESGVFESVTGRLGEARPAIGPLEIRILGRNVGFCSQTVYWAAVISPE